MVAALLLCGAANLGCRRLQPALRGGFACPAPGPCFQGSRAQSYRNACMGVMLAARRAGSQPAATADNNNAPAAPTTVTGSVGFNPNIMLSTNLPASSAPPMPTNNPTATGAASSRIIIAATAPRLAPSATRTPISGVRRATWYANVP
ncbi:hypothetical protein SBA4_210018 [Candidatus Sulfopaludibacter sp. SbA4]|nr:hypothetical protein SBA4_210018 [Candidatus Sulfopaludibacter sp. SbA4]